MNMHNFADEKKKDMTMETFVPEYKVKKQTDEYKRRWIEQVNFLNALGWHLPPEIHNLLRQKINEIKEMVELASIHYGERLIEREGEV